MTREEVLTIVAGLAAAYPRGMSEETLMVYCEDLRDGDAETLAKAVTHLRRTAKFLPTIAEIRAEVAKLTLPHAKPVAEAWTEAVQLMAKIGTYGALGAAGSPYVNRALRLCGRWADICQEDVAWLRKRFVEIYANVVGGAVESVALEGRAPAWLEERRTPLALVGPAKVLEHRRG